MELFIQNLRYGLRLIRNKPAISLVVVLSIAVGVSANATVYTWIRSIVSNPLPAVPQSDRLLALATQTQNGEYITTSYSDYKDYVEQSKGLEGITAFQERPLSVENNGQNQRIWAMMVTANFFDILGVQPARGHFFLPEEQVDNPGGQPVAVISHDFWQSYFGGDSSVIGHTIRLNRQDFTIIGVAPQGFHGTIVGLAFDVWVPLLQQGKLTGGTRGWITIRQYRSLHAIARLRPGVTPAVVQAELNVVSSRLTETFPKENAGIRAVVFPLEKDPFGAQSLMGPVLTVLLLASLGVLLIVCANVANLLLSQAAQREKEMSIRMALGAERSRLLRQLTTEGLLLSMPAAGLSMIFTLHLSSALGFFLPAVDLPVSFAPKPDFEVLIFTVLLSAAAGLLAGFAPALRGTAVELSSSLKEGSRGSTGGRGKQRLRTGLATAEIAVALIALIGAGLLIRSFRNVARIDPGFDYEHVLLAAMTPSAPGHSVSEMQEFYRLVKERVRSLTPVRAVSFAEFVPLGLKGGSWEELEIDGYTPRKEDNMRIYRNLIDDDYFEVMKIPRIEGRSFDQRDKSEAPAVAIVNETFVKRFITGSNTVGHMIRGWGKPLTIVGVVADSKYANSTDAAQPYLYVPFRQFAGNDTEVVLHIAVNGDPRSLFPTVRREVNALNSIAYVSYEQTLKEYIGSAAFKHKIAASLLSVLGITALLLAGLGICGVISHSVTQRANEIGIRMALGASGRTILGMIVYQGVRMAIIGSTIGLLLSVALSRLLSVLLYGVDPIDPVTFVAVSCVIIVVALLASGIPAYRAGRMDPVKALRIT
ncbi:MAG TPA: ABC transporter permease [Terriglobia bacterium]|nr:ABC transporter permease [Terriglobia bacterium]